MDNATVILAKAQILRETKATLNELFKASVDGDYVRYLAEMDVDKILACNDAEDLNEYLIRSRRLSLQEWLDSLTWNHTQQV